MKKAAKSAAPKAVPAKRKPSRAEIYSKHFTSVGDQSRTDGFIPQVNGYGVPVFAQVGSVSGI